MAFIRAPAPGDNLGALPYKQGHPGAVAEWLCSGLQSRVRRFDSAPCLQHFPHPGAVAAKPPGCYIPPTFRGSSAGRAGGC